METVIQQTGLDSNAQAVAAAAAEKVEFTEAQQTYINKQFDQRFAKITAKHEQEKTTLQARVTELEAAPAKPAGAEGVEGAEKAQYKTLLADEKTKTKNAETLAAQRDAELKTSLAENLRIRKENAVRDAAGKHGFLDMEVVLAMTFDKIELDSESKNWVVREGGAIRQNNSLQSMSLEDFYGDFAAKRPYLVSSDMRGGAGSSESRGGGSSLGVVKSKADLKTSKDKSDFIGKFGLAKFEELPLK